MMLYLRKYLIRRCQEYYTGDSLGELNKGLTEFINPESIKITLGRKNFIFMCIKLTASHFQNVPNVENYSQLLRFYQISWNRLLCLPNHKTSPCKTVNKNLRKQLFCTGSGNCLDRYIRQSWWLRWWKLSMIERRESRCVRVTCSQMSLVKQKNN